MNLDGYKCTKFDFDDAKVLAGRFDLHNPCSFCKNLNQNNRHQGPSFHYVESGRWEFPFVAEATCKNFSLIITSGDTPIQQSEYKRAQDHYEAHSRIATLGSKYNVHWFAFDPNDVQKFQGIDLNIGKILYPARESAVEFHRSLTGLRTDMFEIRTLITEMTMEFRRSIKGFDQNTARWLDRHERSLKQCIAQIEELEEKKHKSRVATVSRWAVSGVSGNLAYDALKMSVAAIRKVVIGI